MVIIYIILLILFSGLVVLDDDVMSCHGFIGIGLLWFVIVCRNVDVVMSSSDDEVLSLVWILANLISLMSLFFVLR